jgi:hypothetical protein
MLVEHGLAMLTNTSIGRDLEAQTSLKRGALNLRHARDAFAERVRKVSDLRPADMVPGTPARKGHPATAASYRVSDPEDGEKVFDPSM